MPLLLGAIADDFTGATDLANTLVGEGMQVIQTIGVPSSELDLTATDAVVVALKSRTVPVDDAVRAAREALTWLQSQGARQIVFKYCSTFDSTAAGNIGPVADALMETLEAEIAVICPAFPANRRTVYRGHLFVGDDLLSDSSMKDHPLTPMRDSNLVRLMTAQSRHRVGLVPHEVVALGAEATAEALEDLWAEGILYGVVDAITDADLQTIGRAVAGHKLVTGGSGVALGLPANFREQGLLTGRAAPLVPDVDGRSVILAGSCSPATRAQIKAGARAWPHLKLSAGRLAACEPVADEVIAWALAQDPTVPVLISSSAGPEEVADVQAELGRERAGAMFEAAFGRIAKGLVDRDARRLIVAGGETSGAVVAALGVEALRIGVEIAPGVPWTETLAEPKLALALKSGNFGGEGFFAEALEMLF